MYHIRLSCAVPGEREVTFSKELFIGIVTPLSFFFIAFGVTLVILISIIIYQCRQHRNGYNRLNGANDRGPPPPVNINQLNDVIPNANPNGEDADRNPDENPNDGNPNVDVNAGDGQNPNVREDGNDEENGNVGDGDGGEGGEDGAAIVRRD